MEIIFILLMCTLICIICCSYMGLKKIIEYPNPFTTLLPIPEPLKTKTKTTPIEKVRKMQTLTLKVC